MRADVSKSDRLNLGCGPNAPPSWVNVDGSWNAWLANHARLRWLLRTAGLIHGGQGAEWNVRPLIHDITKPLPFAENTFSAIYASHVLEHLYLDDARRLLFECKRVLKPGGVIRLVVPDLHSIVEEYVSRKNANAGSLSSEIVCAADKMNEELNFRSSSPAGGNVLLRFYTLWKDFHSHKWMYDSESLARYVRAAGFQDVTEKTFLSSAIPGIEEVEKEDRVLDGAGICIEAKKD